MPAHKFWTVIARERPRRGPEWESDRSNLRFRDCHVGLRPPRNDARLALRRFGPRGLTLIELVIVVTLIAALSALAAVRFVGSFQARSLEHGVKDLASYVRFLQYKAIEAGKVHKLALDSDSGKLTAYVQGKKPAEFREITTPFSRRFRDIHSRFTVELERGNEVFFFPNGGVTPNVFTVVSETQKEAELHIKNRLGAFQIKINENSP